jgi:hypothetical protein
VRTDLLTNFAVVTKLKPLLGNRVFLQPKPLRVRTGELGAGEEARSLHHRAIGVADGTFYTLIDIRFHKNIQKNSTTEVSENIENIHK